MKNLALAVSVLLHPLLLLNLGLFAVLRYHPYYISKFYDAQFYTISMFIAVNTLLMPLLSVYLLRRFGFIDDFQISNPSQRLLPYGILLLLLGFTMFQLYKIELNGLPLVFMGASAFCLLLNILINVRFTISTHAIGSGGLLALFAFLAIYAHIGLFTVWLIAAVLAAGLSAWARLFLNAHTEKQVYSGLGLGFAVVFFILLIF